jgi:hypothetical protein
MTVTCPAMVTDMAKRRTAKHENFFKFCTPL